jgi:hypothetical protein
MLLLRVWIAIVFRSRVAFVGQLSAIGFVAAAMTSPT